MRGRARNTRPACRRTGEAGLTLLEALVALALVSVVVIAVLSLLSDASHVVEASVHRGRVQGELRVATHLLGRDISEAGFNVNPDGSASRADEQLEGAWSSALVLRADLDHAAETDLELDTWVTTGEGELVAWLLRPPGSEGIRSLDLRLDLSSPRDASFDGLSVSGEENLSVPTAGAAPVELTSPPYELHRVTISATGELQSRRMASGVSGLTFRYFDRRGAELDPELLGGADDARANRAAVRRIEFELQAVAPRPGLGPLPDVETLGPDSSRTETLAGARREAQANLGRRGHLLGPLPPLPLPAPSWLRACRGHCQRLLLEWEPVADHHRVSVSVDGEETTWLVDEATAELDGLLEGSSAEVRVAGWHEGRPGLATPPLSIVVENLLPENVPSAPAAPAASPPGEEMGLVLSWADPEVNVAPLVGTCLDLEHSTSSPTPPLARALLDLKTIEVHQLLRQDDETGDFSPTDDTLVAELPAGSGDRWPASMAPPCEELFFRLVAVDEGCGSTCDLIRLDLRVSRVPLVTECRAVSRRM